MVKKETGIVLAILVSGLVFGMISPSFLSFANLGVILRASAYTGIMTVGIAFLLISGMIDISIGAIAGLAAIVTSYLIVKVSFPVIPSVLIGLATGVGAGYLNSRLVLALKVPAFLATIGTMYIFRGLCVFISGGYTIYPLPKEIEVIGAATPFGLSVAFLIFLLVAFIGELVLRSTVWGLCVQATGSDREVAFNLEVNVDKINISTYVLCGTLSAISGLMLMARLITGQPNIGLGWELNAITAAAIGGVSLFGYEGSILGASLGVIFIQIIQNGLITIGFSPYLQSVVVGSILVITAVIDVRRKARLRF
jgi:ribose transport system permease protein